MTCQKSFCVAGAILLLTLSEDALHFSWQAQHFGHLWCHVAWQAQHFRRVLLHNFNFLRIALSALREVVTRCKFRGGRGILWRVMKIDGGLARNVDFSGRFVRKLVGKRRFWRCEVWNARKSRTKCSFWCSNMSRLESLAFLWRRRVGQAAKSFPCWSVSKQAVMSSLAWQAWHFVTFQHLSWRVKSRFARQAQYFCDVFRRCVGFFVAGAALWRPPMSFCVACAALSMCRLAYFLRHRIVRAARSGDAHDSTLYTLRAWHTCDTLHSTNRRNSTLYTLYSTLYTSHFTLNTPHLRTLHATLSRFTPQHSTLVHFTLHSVHFTLYTSYFTLHTPHFTLDTLHSTLQTPNFRLYTPHFTLHAPHFTLCTLHSTLYTIRSTLHTLHFTLLHFTLYTSAPHSTLYTLHSTLYTLHSVLYTPYFTLYTLHIFTIHTLHSVHFTLHTLHSTLYTLQSTLCTLPCALYTLHSTLYAWLFTLYTPHFTLHTLHPTLCTPDSTLHTSHFPLHALHFTLCTLHSTLFTFHSTVDSPHFTLYTPHVTLFTPHCTLYTPHFTLPFSSLITMIPGLYIIRVSIRYRGLHLVF